MKRAPHFVRKEKDSEALRESETEGRAKCSLLYRRVRSNEQGRSLLRITKEYRQGHQKSHPTASREVGDQLEKTPRDRRSSFS